MASDVPGSRLPAWLHRALLRAGEEPRVESSWSGAGGPREGEGMSARHKLTPQTRSWLPRMSGEPGTRLPEV